MKKLTIVALFVSVFIPVAAVQGQDLALELVSAGFDRPIFVVSPLGDTNRLFVLEQGGVIRVIKNGALLETAFLDIQSAVTSGGERGLFGLAFHPDYATNGFFFVHYSGDVGQTVLERYGVSTDADVADADSGVVFLTQSQPFTNHNGGMIAFKPNDPEHYLYIGLGDGGSQGDPENRAQDLTTLLGKILRIDVDQGTPATAPESNPFVGQAGDDLIWSYGLRNPWRFSFDKVTADLYIGDVGQGTVEEIDFEPVSSGGGVNYGWRLLEGTLDFNCSDCDDARATTVIPIHEYPRSDGISVTGGYVYRGSAIPELFGHYFFADYGSGNVWSFSFNGTEFSEFQEWTDDLSSQSMSISSFGEGADGELYIVDLSGSIHRIVSAGGATEILLPDLIMDPITLNDNVLDSTTQPSRYLFRFDSSIPNIGRGEFRIESTGVSIGGDLRSVSQHIQEAGGGTTVRPTGGFAYNAESRHMESEGWVAYRIREILPGNEVGPVLAFGQKTSVNITSSTGFDLLLRDGSSLPRLFGSGTMQGISVGYTDIYQKELEFQWIDVTDLSAGNYWLEVEINQGGFIMEEDVTNNVTRIQVFLDLPGGDTEPPVLALVGGASLILECKESFDDPGATATDNVDGDLDGSIVVDDSALDISTPGVYEITYDVEDSAGNAAVQVIRTVTVEDTVAPELALTEIALTLTCGSVFIETGLSALDDCDGDLIDNVVVGGDTIDINTPPGIYTITYDVEDSAGNAAAQASRTVTVEDTVAPELAITGGDMTLECGSAFTDPGATASDDCAGSLTESVVVGGDAVDTNIPGAYVITYDVEDSAGNAATQVTRTVTVEDTTPPVITLIDGDMVIECGDFYIEPGATVTDDCQIELTPIIEVRSNSVDTETPGVYTVSYNATDFAGNADAEVTRTVTVRDTTAPVLELVGADVIVLECGDTFNDLGVTAMDECGGNLVGSVTVGGDTVDTDTLGDYLVTYDVMDSSGNSAAQVGRAVSVQGDCPGEGEGEPSQEIAQELTDNFDAGDADDDDSLDFEEAQNLLAGLTLAEFNALDQDGDNELTRAELKAAGVVPPRAGGCFKAGKMLVDIKTIFGDLFLAALMGIVLLSTSRLKFRP